MIAVWQIRWGSVNTGGVGVTQSFDFVLDQQFTSFEFYNFQIVGRGMREAIMDLFVERLMLLFEFRKMRLHRHALCLLNPMGSLTSGSMAFNSSVLSTLLFFQLSGFLALRVRPRRHAASAGKNELRNSGSLSDVSPARTRDKSNDTPRLPIPQLRQNH
jgi:hypothetical protein